MGRSKISRKLKHKSLMIVLISLMVIGVYYFVYFKALSAIQDLLANAADYGAKIKGAAYPVYLFGSVGVGNVMASVIVSAAVAVLFCLMWVLLSRSFLQIATSTGKSVRREYRELQGGQRDIDTALLCREFFRFAASPGYMLNCGLGMFLMPLCAIILLWKGGELFAVPGALFAETTSAAPLLLCVVLCGLASMNFMTAPSVSLEEKKPLAFAISSGGTFVGVNLFLSVLICLWLRKKGVTRFSALCWLHKGGSCRSLKARNLSDSAKRKKYEERKS